jgi:hypothetical protein
MKTIYILFALLFYGNAFAQDQYITLHDSSSQTLDLREFSETADGGMVLAADLGDNPMIIKLDQNGVVTWAELVQTNTIDNKSFAAGELNNGNLYLLFETIVPALHRLIHYVVFDPNGTLLFTKQYELPLVGSNTGVHLAQKTSNGDISIMLSGNFEGAMMRISENGDLLSANTNVPPSPDPISPYLKRLNSMVASSDGNTYIVAFDYPNLSFMVQDNLGNFVQDITIDYQVANGTFWPKSIVETADGNLLIAGEDWDPAWGGAPSGVCLKVDKNFNRIWEQSYNDFLFETITVLPNGNFVSQEYWGPGYDNITVFDSMGVMIEKHSFGHDSDVFSSRPLKTSADGRLIGGAKLSDTAGFMIFRIDASPLQLCAGTSAPVNSSTNQDSVHTLHLGPGIVTNVGIETTLTLTTVPAPVWTTDSYCALVGVASQPKHEPTISAYPNPASSFVNIDLNAAFEMHPTPWQLYNSTGGLVKSGSANLAHFRVDVQDLAVGLYYFQTEGASSKVIVVR